MKKKQFSSPLILQEVHVGVENNFLASLIYELAVVESSGQEVQTHDFSENNSGGFNHEWE